MDLFKPYSRNKKSDALSLSYITLRQLIGFLGIMLPAVCILGGFTFAGLGIQRSISFYYHTNMRDFFVGLMFGVGFFLLSYKGYARIDTILAVIMGISGIGIAAFPCMPAYQWGHIGMFMLPERTSDILHTVDRKSVV